MNFGVTFRKLGILERSVMQSCLQLTVHRVDFGMVCGYWNCLTSLKKGKQFSRTTNGSNDSSAPNHETLGSRLMLVLKALSLGSLLVCVPSP